MNKKAEKNQRIQVFARCRPLNSIEKKQFSPSIVEVIPEKKEIVIKDRSSNREFFFDKVFPPDTNQISVYKAVVAPLIQEVLMGYNCTVFAYGQTGTGKTYTMEGDRNNTKCSWEEDPAAGIIPRSLHQLFEELNKEENVEFSVRVSFLELYNEELFDLLSVAELSRLRLFEDSSRKGSVIIQGLEEINVNTKDEVYAILEKGSARRQTAATILNASSSRSHTVFSVTVHIKENTVEGEELLKTGKLNLVDLAGSENVGRSGAVDKRAREAGNINQSLLTLGRVITALIEKQPHVPYRESKLTRLLQDSLGGHTKTSIIATISPALCNFDETISTLDYATKAKSITIRPEINQKMTKRALIREYTEEIERLRKDLDAQRSNDGFYIHLDNYTSMQKEIVVKTEAIKSLTDQIELVTEKKLKMEEIFTLTKEELKQTSEQLAKVTRLYDDVSLELARAINDLAHSKKVILKTTLERDEKQHLITVLKKTEIKLSQQAKTLLQVADDSTNDTAKLHAKLDRKTAVENENEKISNIFKICSQQGFATLDDYVSSCSGDHHKDISAMRDVLNNFTNNLNKRDEVASNALHCTLSDHELKINDYLSDLDNIACEEKKWTDNALQEMSLDLETNASRSEVFLSERLPSFSKEFRNFTEQMEKIVDNFKQVSSKKIDDIKGIFGLKKKKKEDLVHSVQQSLSDVTKTEVDKSDQLTKEFELLTQRQNKIDELKVILINLEQEQKEGLHKVIEIFNKGKSTISSLLNIQKPLDDLHNELNELITHQNSLDDLKTIINLDEFAIKKDSLQHCFDQQLKEVHDFTKDTNQLGQESSTNKKTSLDNHLSEISKSVGENKNKLKDITNSLSERLNSDRCSLETHNATLENITRNAGVSLDESETKIKQNAEKLRRHILQMDLQCEKFISEDLVKDIPTGSTPNRKQFVYPKYLVATSPHEQILQKYRSQLAADMEMAINLPLDSSFNDSGESKTSNDDEGSHNASIASDEYDCCETDSNISSVSDISVDSYKGKENKLNKKKNSKLPKRIRKNDAFLVPAPRRSSRKPLTTSNQSTPSKI